MDKNLQKDAILFYKTMREFNKTETFLATVYTRFGVIMAASARIEGMKAENKQREICETSMAYVEKDFEEQAIIIDRATNYLSNLL